MLIVTSILSAKTYSDKGLYGSLGFSYSEQELSSTSYYSSRESLEQIYMLGYQGFVYSPLFLDYTLEGLFRLDDENVNSDGLKTKRTNDSKGYKANLDFLKKTRYPFSIFANTQQSPISIISYNNNIYQTYDLDRKGINGSIDLDSLKLTYGALKTEGISESNTASRSIETDIYNSSLKYTNDQHNVQLNYQHRKETIAQQYIENNESLNNDSKQIQNKFDIRYLWDVSKDFKFSSNASYLEDSLYSTKTTSANVNLNWNPKEKYNASMSMGTSQYKYLEDTMNSYDVNQNFGYKFSPSFYISEIFNYYKSESSKLSSDSLSLLLMANYRYDKIIFNDIRFNFFSSLSAQENETNTVSKVDNITNNNQKETYRVNLNARASKQLPSINSNFMLSSTYSNSITSEDEKLKNYSLNSFLSSKIFSIFTNILDAKYMQYDRSVNSVDGKTTTTKSTKRSIEESIGFPLRFGLRGGMSFRVGVTNIVYTNNEETQSSTSPTADISLNYRFFTKLMFKSAMRIYKNFDTTYRTGNADLTFRSGKTYFAMGYQYNKSETTGEQLLYNTKRSNFKVTLTRRF
ncbi:hypothetical protein [Sulfurimonas sp.]|uniref:hypothetical protein n=1 Tax=Sulfurimonas sp. TaxID=2022749 RepID=UPI0035617A98